MRLIALVIALVLVAAAAAGCRHEKPPTSLTLVAKNSFVGEATFRLTCDPPGGDVPDARAVCERLGDNRALLRDPRPFTCFGGTFSWWDIRITGRHDGESVDTRVSTCWTPQMKLIRVLGIARELERHIDPLSRPAWLDQ